MMATSFEMEMMWQERLKGDKVDKQSNQYLFASSFVILYAQGNAILPARSGAGLASADV